MSVQDILERDAGPLPVGGWVLMVGGAAVIVFTLRNQRARAADTVVQQVPVPVGAIAAVDQGPTYVNSFTHVNVPQFEALVEALTGQTEATKANTGELVNNTKGLGEVRDKASEIVNAIPVLSQPAPAPATPAKQIVPYPGHTSQQGSKGGIVKLIQQQLNAKAGAGLVVDGIFGPKTRAAVVAYQRSRGLLVDGIVGPQTWGSLFA